MSLPAKDFLKAKSNQSQQENGTNSKDPQETSWWAKNNRQNSEKESDKAATKSKARIEAHEAKENGQHARRQNSGENVDAETNKTPKYGE